MYNKIFTKILDSSIWLEPDGTRLIWLTLIAAMDEEGVCRFASVANLAHRARVSLEVAKEAVIALEGPDENSSDPDNEGRRIERIPGGWIVLNAQKYRELVTRTVIKEQTRARVAKHRAKRTCNADVTQSEAVSESKEEEEKRSRSAELPLFDEWMAECKRHLIAEWFAEKHWHNYEAVGWMRKHTPLRWRSCVKLVKGYFEQDGRPMSNGKGGKVEIAPMRSIFDQG
jgi:hypothetical protein